MERVVVRAAILVILCLLFIWIVLVTARLVL